MLIKFKVEQSALAFGGWVVWAKSFGTDHWISVARYSNRPAAVMVSWLAVALTAALTPFAVIRATARAIPYAVRKMREQRRGRGDGAAE